jgi:hypothetical protein
MHYHPTKPSVWKSCYSILRSGIEVSKTRAVCKDTENNSFQLHYRVRSGMCLIEAFMHVQGIAGRIKEI